MNCDDTMDEVGRLGRRDMTEADREALCRHLLGCADCQAVIEAVRGLADFRNLPVPEPASGAFERVLYGKGTAPPRPAPRSRFWTGAASGAAVAASLLMAAWLSGVLPQAAGPMLPPVATVALDEPQNLDIAIDLERDLPQATITVSLRGDIELDGYAGRRQLSWQADLAGGVNRLSLPVVARDAAGGRLLVEVAHGNRTRRFTVDVLPG